MPAPPSVRSGFRRRPGRRGGNNATAGWGCRPGAADRRRNGRSAGTRRQRPRTAPRVPTSAATAGAVRPGPPLRPASATPPRNSRWRRSGTGSRARSGGGSARHRVPGSRPARTPARRERRSGTARAGSGRPRPASAAGRPAAPPPAGPAGSWRSGRARSRRRRGRPSATTGTAGRSAARRWRTAGGNTAPGRPRSARCAPPGSFPAASRAGTGSKSTRRRRTRWNAPGAEGRPRWPARRPRTPGGRPVPAGAGAGARFPEALYSAALCSEAPWQAGTWSSCSMGQRPVGGLRAGCTIAVAGNR